MKFRVLALFLLIHPLLGRAKADDRLYFYIECSQGQQCIEMAYANGKTESVLAVPAQVLARGDLQSASVQTGGNAQSLNMELSSEASAKLEKITGDNLGKKLIVVFDNRILTAPTIVQPIASRKITIGNGPGGQGLFWEKAPWLQDLIKDSYKAGGRSVMIYGIIALAVAVFALIFVLLPRMRRTRPSSSE